MRKLLILFLFWGNLYWTFAQEISGNTLTEDGIALEKVLIINLKTGEKTYSDNDGNFSISAKNGEEIRLVREGYDRHSHITKSADFGQKLTFKMNKAAANIQEVVITKVSKEKMAELKNSIGLPEPLNTKPKIPTAKSVLLPALLGNLNIDGMKDLISGDARRKRALYQYEDFQEHVEWIADRIYNDYFIEKGLPEDRIREFIGFAITERPAIKSLVKKKDIRQIEKQMEGILPKYLSRLKQ